MCVEFHLKTHICKMYIHYVLYDFLSPNWTITYETVGKQEDET